MDDLAKEVGAAGWTVVRERKHLVVDFHFPGGDVRQVMAATGSDHRLDRNVVAQLRRAIRMVGA
jgi:hypothetical protein